MADDDLLEQARALQQRAQTIRADAATLRQGLTEELNPIATELGLASDRALRAQMTADHAVADADARVAQLQASVAEMRKEATRGEARIAAANKKGKAAEAEEEQENLDKAHDLIEQGEARVLAARLEAAELREPAGAAERAAMEAKIRYDEVSNAGLAAEEQIDKIEQQAALVEQARMKLIEADLKYGGEPPLDADLDKWIIQKAVLEEEAAALLQQADAITIDRDVIAKAIPSADDPPPASDDLMDPNEAAAAALPAIADDGDALGLDLVEPDTEPDGGDEAPTDEGAGDTAAAEDLPVDAAVESAATDVAATATEPAGSVLDGTFDAAVAEFTGDVWDGLDPQDEQTGFDGGGQDELQDDGESDDFGADGF